MSPRRLKSRSFPVAMVGPMPTCGRRDVSVLDGRTLTGLLEHAFLLRPDMGDRHVEAVDAAVQRIDEACEPSLERLPLPAFLRPDPVRRVAVPLRRLADDVRVEKPAHNLRRFGRSPPA